MKKLFAFMLMALHLLAAATAHAFQTGKWSGEYGMEGVYGDLEIKKTGNNYSVELFIYELVEDGYHNEAQGYFLQNVKGEEKNGGLLVYYGGKPAFSIENKGGLKVKPLVKLSSLPKNLNVKVYLKAADIAKMKWSRQ